MVLFFLKKATFHLRWCLLFIFAVFFLGSCKQKNYFFTSLSSSQTGIDFTNHLENRKAFGILYYLYYYNGGGVSTGDINNDGLPDIYFTANSKGANKLYLNKGNFQFEDITKTAGVAGISDWSSGVTMADVNADGLLDIYVSAVANHHGLQGQNALYINNGNNRFTESAAKYGLNFSGFSTQSAFFDYDHDGDLDCYILNQSHKPNQNIIDTSNRRKFDAYAGDRLYRNDMNTPSQKFTDVSAEAGIYQSSLGYGLGLAVADINNDGWEDIYVGNDFHENDYYYVNRGNGTFEESGAKVFGHYSRFSMGNDIADYNNDGQLDIVTMDMLPNDEKILKTYGSDENADIYHLKIIQNGFQYQYSKNCLQRNNGNGSSFSETALLSGVAATDWSWAPLFADFDNDGAKDLFITSGIVKRPVDLDFVKLISNLSMQREMNASDKYDEDALKKMPDGSSRPYFFKGDGKLLFNDVSESWGTAEMKGYFNGASYADLDNDGDLDVVANCIDAKALVLKNNAPPKAHMTLSFRGKDQNRSGIGAKAYVFSGGKMQYQQLMLTRGFQSSCEPRLHFGLDNETSVDSLLVVWPDQSYQVVKNISANKFLTIDQEAAGGTFSHSDYFSHPAELLSPATNVSLDWQHKENDFTDFNVQYLIPHAQSTRGPKIAVGDVNNDGKDDFYVCGAKNQKGALGIRGSGKSFAIDTISFADDAASEDVDAIFFDANGDKALDLYVVSGGNETIGQDPVLLDRLYFNDGKGHFTKSNTLPALYANKSCVAVNDVDKDGDNDIFVGTLSHPQAYGLPQTSYLLLNDGKGIYSIAPENRIALSTIGTVTTAAFEDLNRDGWKDLVVTGEWMPMMVFMNNRGCFAKNAIPGSSGWWQTIFLDDLNGDGNMDMLAGNWGCNNKFWSGKNGPVNLYVSDFDKNGRTDQLLSYTLNGQEFPFLAKDEVEKSLPQLKKHYLSYSEYAGVVMKDVFYGWVDTIKPYKAERMPSAVFWGDGKGGFTIQDLPAEMQLAPIFSFQKVRSADGRKWYIAGGNFFDVIPYEGRYDAQPLAVFSVGKDRSLQYHHQPNLFTLKTQVRDMKWLRTTANEDIFTVAGNNTNLQFYTLNK